MRRLLALVLVSGCSSAGDGAAATPVDIRVTNQRATPIFVAQQDDCFDEPVIIKGPGGRMHWHTRDHGEQGGACQEAGVYQLDAGKTLTATWDGTQRIDNKREPARPGSYTFQAQAWSACAECTCAAANELRRCEKPQSLAPQPDLTARQTVTLPAAAPVEVVFR